MKTIITVSLVLLELCIFAQSKWNVKYFVDEFGDPTEKGYVVGIHEGGSYSDAYTDNGKLTVSIYVYAGKGGNYVTMKLWEGGNKPVVAKADQKYLVKIKDSKGEVHVFNMASKKGYNQCVDYTGNLYKLLKKGTTIKIYLVELHNVYKAKYNITVDCRGFTYAINNL